MAWFCDQFAEQDIVSSFVDLGLERSVQLRVARTYYSKVPGRNERRNLPGDGTCWVTNCTVEINTLSGRINQFKKKTPGNPGEIAVGRREESDSSSSAGRKSHRNTPIVKCQESDKRTEKKRNLYGERERIINQGYLEKKKKPGIPTPSVC